jgi:anaerobic magnesium-protoporphyrin IX monomethyl ester cyclase
MGVDVLIGQAYFLRFDPPLWAAQRPYAPLGALYAAASVRAAGYDVALFDAMLAESELEWDAALDEHRPAVAVLYEDSFNYLSKMCLLRMREAAIAMIGAARRRNVPVLVAGSDATDHPSMYLQAGARAVIAGEGEVTLVHVLEALNANTRLEDVEGLVLTSEHGGTVRTPARPIVRELATLPPPAWDLVDVERYRAIWTGRHGFFSMNIATTRGCPYHCNWCAKPIYGQRYTARTADDVADEIRWLKETYAPDHLWVTDDIFGLKPGWIEAFSQAVVQRDAVIPFKCLMRADGINQSIVTALKAAGCRTVWVGAESGSQRVLDAMEKGTRVEQIDRASQLLQASGIEVCFFLQFGFPGETLNDIQLTVDMVRRNGPEDIGISVSYPLPGTPFYERVRAQLGDKQNWVNSADLDMMYRATFSPEFYRALHAWVHAKFRTWRAVDVARNVLAGRRRLVWRDIERMPSLLLAIAKLPVLSRRVDILSRTAVLPDPMPILVPLLNQQAAAMPTDQRQ